MKKLIVVGFFGLFSVLGSAAVQVQIDPTEVNIDESFRLILTQDELQSGGVPDVTPLQKNFVILGTERRMNYSIINGQSQSSSEWTITLKPQKEGILTIPSIKVGTEHTNPLEINVSKSTTPKNTRDNATSQDNQDIYLTTHVDKPNPFVNQQIIYKVTLYNSKHLLDANYQGPQVENALLIPLGEEKRFQTQKNNVNYLVEEQKYAVFPQKSGRLKIKPPVFTALIYDFNPQRVKVMGKTITFDVQPIPKTYVGKDWLPAKKVTLNERYDNSGDSITQGNTLIRSVTLDGVGVPAQLLPKLNFAEPDGVPVYPEQGKDKNQLIQGELIGHNEIKVTYLFNKSGKITIPELKLPWFNTETGKEEIATLPAKTLFILPSTTSKRTGIKETIPPKNQSVLPAKQEMNESTLPRKSNWAWMFTLLFACAWLVTLALWVWQKRTKNTDKRRYKKALNDLHNACTQGNPQHTRDALLQWASLYWPDAPILNLTDLTRLTLDTSFKKQVQLLSQILYKNQGRTLWRGDELWRSIQQIKKTNGTKKENVTVLPPINPS